MKECQKETLRVINIGLQGFCEALETQGAAVIQVEWRPPVRQSEEISQLLDDLI